MQWPWCGSSRRANLTIHMWCRSPTAPLAHLKQSWIPQSRSLDFSLVATTASPSQPRQQMALRQLLCTPYSTSWSKVETLNTTAIHLVWMKPLDYKNGYTYRVTTTGCGSKNITVAGEDTLISELTPGTNCTFCVYVRAVDGTEGQANCTSQYTRKTLTVIPVYLFQIFRRKEI